MNHKGALYNQFSLGNSENCLEEVDLIVNFEYLTYYE